MRTAGVIGWPIAHSKSPLIHRFWLQALGLDGDYSRFAVEPGQLGAAIRALPALGLSGVNVTVPHKIEVMTHLDEVEPVAAAIGAVNTVVVESGRLIGTNTDMAGFLEPLSHGPVPERAVVVGAGGAARAVLLGLKQWGVAEILVMNRSLDRAAALLGELEISGTAIALSLPVPEAGLLVNASSLGMKGQPPLRLDLAAMPARATVYDIVYAPLQTELLIEADARGMRCVDGLNMLIGQAAVAFERFFGAPAPREHDEALRSLLLGKQG